MKLRFLMPHCNRKNSVKDKVIGKKWIYSDSERSTLHRVWAITEGECSQAKCVFLHSVQFSSVSQSCRTLCDPMNHSTPGLPVYHQLPEFTKTHVQRVSDVIQPSHSLLSPFPTAPNSSQHQSLFQ